MVLKTRPDITRSHTCTFPCYVRISVHLHNTAYDDIHVASTRRDSWYSHSVQGIAVYAQDVRKATTKNLLLFIITCLCKHR